MLGTRELLPGTLDMLVLQALTTGREHGYGILLRIEAAADGLLTLEQGSLYPALARLERRGAIEAEWGRSENNRRAKFYRLTPKGRTRLRAELERWGEMVATVATVLDKVTRPGSPERA